MQEEQEKIYKNIEDYIKTTEKEIKEDEKYLEDLNNLIKCLTLKSALEKLIDDNEEYDPAAMLGEWLGLGSDGIATLWAVASILQAASPRFLKNKIINAVFGLPWTIYEFSAALIYAKDVFSNTNTSTFNRAEKEAEAIGWVLSSGISLVFNIVYLAAVGKAAVVFYPLLAATQMFESWYYFFHAQKKYEESKKKLDDPVYFLQDRIDRYELFSYKIRLLEAKKVADKANNKDDDTELEKLKFKKARIEVQIKAWSKVHYEKIKNNKPIQDFFENGFYKETFKDITPTCKPTPIEKKLVEKLEQRQEEKMLENCNQSGSYLAESIGYTFQTLAFAVGHAFHPLLIVGTAILVAVGLKKIPDIYENVETLLSDNSEEIEFSDDIRSAYKSEDINKRLVKFSSVLGQHNDDEKLKYLMAYDFSSHDKNNFTEEHYYQALTLMNPVKRQKILNSACQEYITNYHLKKEFNCNNDEELHQLHLSEKDKAHFASSFFRAENTKKPAIPAKNQINYEAAGLCRP